MNKRGHIIFALAFGLITLSIVSSFISLPGLILLIHLPFYLLGAVLVDKIESSKRHGVNHRKFFHSHTMLIFTTLILIPLCIWRIITSPSYHFQILAFSHWSIGLAIALGHTTHLIGDSLTSKLPRR